MKKMIIAGMLFINAGGALAQTFEEWFKQKETQIKYLREQIGALSSYHVIMNKGYDIAQRGLKTIEKSKGEDLDQHRQYIFSLRNVKPRIKNYSKVVSIEKMKAIVTRECRDVAVLVTPDLTGAERDYITRVYVNLLAQCNGFTSDLEMVISDNALELKDDERIQRIDNIYEGMQELLQFCHSFAAGIRQLVQNRKAEIKELQNNFRLFEIK